MRSSACGGLGQRPVAVEPFGLDVVDLGVGGHRGQAAVGLQAEVLPGDVVGGQVGGDGQVQLDLGRRAQLLALQLGHRLGDHLHVQVVADGGDVAGLVAAEQVAGAPDLEVAHGDLEPRAQLGVLADGAQPLVGLLGQDLVGGEEQVGVGPLPGPAHPAPQLVELAQAEAVGPVDHQGVDGGHVDARLDDGRADQHVVGALPEVEDDLLQGAFVHLAVGHRHPGLGHQGPQLGGHLLDGRHPVVDVEDLAFAQQLPPDGLGHGPLVVLADVGEDGLAVGRRGVQQGEVPDPGQAHLQGPGDRRGGQGEHVDVGAQLLDGLLVVDPEALLLVDDQQAEVLERAGRPTAAGGCRSPRPPTRRPGRPPPAGPGPGSGTGTASRPGPDSRRSGRRRSGSAARPAGWSGPAPPPACRPAPP